MRELRGDEGGRVTSNGDVSNDSGCEISRGKFAVAAGGMEIQGQRFEDCENEAGDARKDGRHCIGLRRV